MDWNEMIPKEEITKQVTGKTVDFAKRFGEHLGKNDMREKLDKRTNQPIYKDGKKQEEISREKLTTNQLRKFFGEVKRQQMKGYDVTDFVLLKPKLAYAVGRTKGNDPKIKDFYKVMSNAIDQVNDEKTFRNFIKIFEAIVAYHKATEENKL